MSNHPRPSARSRSEGHWFGSSSVSRRPVNLIRTYSYRDSDGSTEHGAQYRMLYYVLYEVLDTRDSYWALAKLD